MTYIYNKVERMIKWGMMLCLLALLPMSVLADEYGISEEYDTWQQKYLTKINNGELAAREALLSGEGTKESPYLIETEWDLCRLADHINNGKVSSYKGYYYKDKYFKLVNDIDLNGAVWYPIAVKSDTYFAGYFDGNGKTVRNMRIVITNSTEQSVSFAYGLFGYLRGVIRNLNISKGNIEIEQGGTNEIEDLDAGLLCGIMSHDTWFTSDDVNYGSIYAAVYGCNVEGEISGKAQNYTDLYYKTRVGGLIGQIQAPASVYRCHADVKITTRRINWIGGIAGYIENDINWEKGSINSELFPSWSYLFDCTANVNITARTDAEGKEASVGGICGMNDGGNIMACGAVGNIELDVAEDVDDPEIDGHQVGGIAGTNNRNIIDCASGVSLFGIHEVGGIVGLSEKNNNLTSSFGTIINCVYSGHIDATHALSAHGIVGNTEKHNTSSAIVNSLFLGTITYEEGKSGKAVAPLWEEESEASGNNNQNVEENNYSDMNLYDEGNNLDNVYRTFLEFTSGKTSLVPFRGTFSFDKLYGKEDINVGGAWQFQEGFYPRLQIGTANITNVSGSDRTTNDRIIIRAATAMGDDAADLKTPKLFPAYAWLASVPAGFNNDGGSAQFLDAPLSLAAKRQVMDANTQNVAHYSLPANQTLLTVTGETDAQTATPKVNAVGNVMLTVTTADNISKQLRLDVNGSRTWDGKTGRLFDDGKGTEDSPYLIHNARQLIKAFSSNDAGEYYKLKNDIWFNENLLTADGNISNTGVAWSDTEKRWKAHLDGDGHAIRGLYASSVNSMLGSIAENASLENVAFVDCAVKTQDNASGVGGFLATEIGANTVVRNCLFDGLYHRQGSGFLLMGGLSCSLGGEAASKPTIEDCVVAVWTKNISPIYGLFLATDPVSTVKRILVLNNNLALNGLTNSTTANTDCYFPAGYLPMNNSNFTKDAKAVDEMTNGTFFSGDGFDKWTARKGRFPMLKSFAETAYGKLISLPIYTDNDNRFDKMNYLMDFTPGNATWQSTNETVTIDTDIRVIEPKTASSNAYLVRSLDEAKVITPLTTAEEITTGIKFEDPEAKAFCVAHYDDNNDGEVSLSELKGVLLEEFQANMNEDDGDPNDNDGALIEKFPEFRYFAGISDLGTSFQDKNKLQMLEFSNKITELSDNDFRGNTSMTAFTIPTSVKSVSGQAFAGSGLTNFEVETDHSTFAAVDGLLLSGSKDMLVSYPSGRTDASIDLSSNIKSIGQNAIYKLPQLNAVYIDAADYDYETVVELAGNGIVHAQNGSKMQIYIEDATNDDYSPDADAREYTMRAPRRAGETGEGNPHLLNKYKAAAQWQTSDMEISNYWDLVVSANSKDGDNKYWATMFIGFDTELPEGLTPYIVDKEKTKESETTLVLREINRKVPMMTPVVIMADEAKTYRLYPSKEARWAELPMSENLLEGINRNGLQVNQADANDGGCLTLGKNKSGEIGFFIYKGTAKIPAFRAYISVNKVGYAAALTFSYADDETNDINSIDNGQLTIDNSGVYNLAGQRVGQPSKGIYIKNGRKYVIK